MVLQIHSQIFKINVFFLESIDFVIIYADIYIIVLLLVVIIIYQYLIIVVIIIIFIFI